MYSLTYVSSAAKPLPPRELRDLLTHCVTNNRMHNVTGMLLYKDGNFMQALEGEEAAVKAVHEVIGRDPRHRGLITLLQGMTPGRSFPEWSMGFRDLGADLDNPEGYTEFLNLPLTDKAFISNPSNAQKLLLGFKQTR
jgi:hypothetical protein